MNAEDLIIKQYELVRRKNLDRKKASDSYANCIRLRNDDLTCIGKLIQDIQESGNILDPDEFDNAVKGHCCKYCQDGWNSSKSVKTIKKQLAALKHSMHALAKRLLKEKQQPNHANSADAKSRAAD